MTDKLRIRIAAGVTALFLAAISAAGLAAHQDPTPAGAAAGSGPPVVAPRSDDEGYDDEGYDDEGYDEEGGEHD